MYLYLESVLTLIKGLHFYSCLVELPILHILRQTHDEKLEALSNIHFHCSCYRMQVESEMCASLCSWKVRCVLHFVDENRVVHEVYQWTQQKDRIRKL